MHREIFDTESGTKFPLTKTRMAEIQSDIQAPMNLLATMLPLEECILAGCAEAGDAGYALLRFDDGNGGYVYEVLEVRAGSVASYLKLTVPEPITARNSDNTETEVAVRQERYLEWSANTNGIYREYANLKRLWVKKAPQDDGAWITCTNNTNWNAVASGTVLRVAWDGGRVHLSAQLTYQPWLKVSQDLIASGYFDGVSTPAVNSVVRASLVKSVYQDAAKFSAAKQAFSISFLSNVMRLPEDYRPEGDVLVPVFYNNTPAFAIIGSDGKLTLDRDPEIGDTIKIDTYFEV